jgi:hypothetical protein
MCVWRNTELRSCNHCYSGNAISFIYSECMFVTLGIQHAMRMRHIVICGLPRSTVLFHISKMARFSKTRYWIQNVCFGFFYNFRLKHISFYEEVSEMWSDICIGLHVKNPLFLSDFNETWIFSQVFKKSWNIKFLITPYNGMRVVPCRRTDRRTDMTKLIVAFRNFANARTKLFPPKVTPMDTGISEGNSSASYVMADVRYRDPAYCCRGIATHYGLGGPGFESQWREILHNCPDRHCGPPSFLYNGYRFFWRR